MSEVDALLAAFAAGDQSAFAPLSDLLKEQRGLEEPLPVRLHHVPNWLRLRILRVWPKGEPKYMTAGDWLLNRLLFSTGALVGDVWLDHWGSVPQIGTRVPAFVSEPYGFREEQLEAAVCFAKALGLTLAVSQPGAWHSGTTRYLFVPEVP